MAFAGSPKASSAEVRKGVLLLAKLAEAADQGNLVNVIAADKLFRALPEGVRATSREHFSAANRPAAAVVAMPAQEPADLATAKPGVPQERALGSKTKVEGAPSRPAVSGVQAADDAASPLTSALSNDDISDIAKEFGVQPDRLNALVESPEFERMVAEELARRSD